MKVPAHYQTKHDKSLPELVPVEIIFIMTGNKNKLNII